MPVFSSLTRRANQGHINIIARIVTRAGKAAASIAIVFENSVANEQTCFIELSVIW